VCVGGGVGKHHFGQEADGVVVGRRRLHDCRIWARWLRGVFVLEKRLPRHLAAVQKQNCADPLDGGGPRPTRKFEQDRAGIVLKSSSTACSYGGRGPNAVPNHHKNVTIRPWFHTAHLKQNFTQGLPLPPPPPPALPSYRRHRALHASSRPPKHALRQAACLFVPTAAPFLPCLLPPRPGLLDAA
jgi:hypothetical protein